MKSILVMLIIVALSHQQAQTHSIMKKVQQDIAKLHLPRSFFQKRFTRRNLKKKVQPKKKKQVNKQAKQFRFKQIHHKKQSLVNVVNNKPVVHKSVHQQQRLKKKHSKVQKINPNEALGSIQIHVQLPTRNVDELINLMDYDKEVRCSYKEGFMTTVIKSDCNQLWTKPTYVLLTPESFKLCDKADKTACFSEVPLCQVSHIYTPKDWESSPCFQVMGKEKNQNGENMILAQICASDYPAAMGWQHAILSYHRCIEGAYTH